MFLCQGFCIAFYTTVGVVLWYCECPAAPGDAVFLGFTGKGPELTAFVLSQTAASMLPRRRSARPDREYF
jgi:hypothetical protein